MVFKTFQGLFIFLSFGYWVYLYRLAGSISYFTGYEIYKHETPICKINIAS